MLADKPQIEELRYFLEFQVPRVWAPVQDRFPGQQRKEPVCPHLQFSMMGQKLYVSQEQVCRFLNLEIDLSMLIYLIMMKKMISFVLEVCQNQTCLQ